MQAFSSAGTASAPPGAPLERAPGGANGESTPARRTRRWIAFAALWVALLLLTVAHLWMLPRPAGEEAALGRTFLYGIYYIAPWALLSLLAVGLARRFPVDPERSARVVAPLVGVAVGFVLVGRAMLYLTGAGPRTGDAASFLVYLRSYTMFPLEVMTAALVIGTGYAVVSVNRLREREVQQARLEGELTRAQLQALKMQLHPHFLFNTLNAVSSLIRSDPVAADEMVERLGDLLRATLRSGDRQEVTLAEELEFLRPYLEIEQVRLGSRLQLGVEVAPEACEALVPHLLLQPLVENAIRHGIAPRAEGGRIWIDARVRADRLRLEVRDSGCGLHANGAGGAGIGLANVRARLKRLYGAAHHFSVEDHGAGVRARVELPYSRRGASQGGEG